MSVEHLPTPRLLAQVVCDRVRSVRSQRKWSKHGLSPPPVSRTFVKQCEQQWQEVARRGKENRAHSLIAMLLEHRLRADTEALERLLTETE